MPSSNITQIAEIRNIRKHDNADALQVAEINGWQVVTGLGCYKEGDLVAYIQPDSLIPESLADALEIKHHLNSVKNPDGSFVTNDKGEVMWRVRQTKLRGEPSFGTTVPESIFSKFTGHSLKAFSLGHNVAELLGIMKYEPQMRSSAGDAEVDHPLFPKYTSIENLRNYPNVLKEGEPVYVTQKIHGTNCRVGIVEGELMAGSHGLRRKRPSDEEMKSNTYWFPLTLDSVKNLLNSFYEKGHKQVILYGEVYGNVQKKYNYGVPNGISFRAFDLLIDGEYKDYNFFVGACKEFDVPFVEFFDSMEYNYDNLVNYVESIEQDPLGQHPLEGVVIRPYLERYDHKVGRVIFKYITNAYLFDKKKSDYLDK